MSGRWFAGKARLYFGLAVALALLGTVAGLGAAWQMSRHDANNPAAVGDASAQRPLDLAAPVLGEVAPVDQQAVSTDFNVSPMVGVAPPRSGVMSLMDGNSGASGGLWPGLALAVIGVFGSLVVVALLRRRRALLAPVAVLAATMLAVLPALSAFAGAGTATQWGFPHTFSDYPYALAKDAPNNLLYFAEHMVGGTDPGRIGQLNLSTNDLVEWPTTAVLGTSMEVVGGKVFFTEPAANIIGRLDPPTNTFTRWQLPTAGGNAIIFWVDGANDVWYLSASADKIGRLNPATNDITEWAMAAAGTPIWFYGRDAAGDMWFSLPNTGATDSRIGRLVLSTNQITLWPVPASITESVQVAVVNGGTVWFSGVVGSTALHFARLDTGTNQVTRWTIVPTDTPGAYAYPLGYTDDYYGYPPYEVSVATGRYRQLSVVDSSGRPWFVVEGPSQLTRLDPATNQLLEFGFYGKFLDMNGSNVITALYRAGGAQAMVEFFDTTTNSVTQFVVPLPTTGFLMSTNTEFWFTSSVPGAKVERLVVTP